MRRKSRAREDARTLLALPVRVKTSQLGGARARDAISGARAACSYSICRPRAIIAPMLRARRELYSYSEVERLVFINARGRGKAGSIVAC